MIVGFSMASFAMSSGHRCIWPLIFMIFVSGLHTGVGSTTDTLRKLLQTTGTFCVATPSADSQALQAGLNWVCGAGGANCAPIQPGQPCYVANNLALTTSWAYNDYYQKNRANGATCNFNNTAAPTNTDPSHGSCSFVSNSSTTTVSAPPPFNNSIPGPPPPFNSIISPPPPLGFGGNTTFPASPPINFDSLSCSLVSMKALMLASIVSLISSLVMHI